MKLKYDIYESFIDGSGEHKMTKQQVRNVLSSEELKRMTSDSAEEIVKGNLKYWAEEAINYSAGISVP